MLYSFVMFFWNKSAPRFIKKLIQEKSLYSDEIMELAIAIALQSAKNGYGPFGAVISKEGKIVSFGYNNVISACDSTSHAEIMAIRNCQKKFGTHDLSKYELKLYSSAAPCIQCFGAIYWSGIKEIYSSATQKDVERYGFCEGPVNEELWKMAKKQKEIWHLPHYMRTKETLAPFEEYKKRNGRIY